MRLSRIFFAALGLVAAASVGYWFGYQQTATESPAAPESIAVLQSDAPTEAAECADTKPPAAEPALCKSRYSGMGPVDLLALPTDFEQTVALYTVAAEADVAGLGDLIEQAMAIPIEGERDAALSILYMRYSDLDPDGAIEHMYRLGLQGHASVLFVMFNGWAKTDLDAAIERSYRLRSAADRRQANNAILRAHASEQPAELAAIENRLKDVTGSYQPRALAQRARTEPLAAMAAAMAIKNPGIKRDALRWIASVWAEQDGPAALAYGEQLEDARLKQIFRQSALGKYSQNAPVAALKRLGSGSPEDDQVILSGAISTLASRNPQQALHVANQISAPAHQRTARSAVLQIWAQRDPVAAAAALELMPDLSSDQRLNLGHQVAYQYAQVDASASLDWAFRVEGHRGRLWQTALDAVSQSDPPLALSLLAQMESSARQAELLSNLMANVARSDPALAISNLDRLPPGDLRSRAVTGIASSWIETDPTAAMDWLLAQSPHDRTAGLQNVVWRLASMDPLLAASYVDEVQGEARGHYIGTVVDQFARQDAAAAAAWLTQFADDSQYGHWTATVASHYAASDPRAGVRLLNRLEDEPFKMALGQFLAAWARHDPEAAGKWWHRIDDDRRAESALQNLVSTWQQYDPEAAEKWVLRLSDSNERDQGLSVLAASRTLEPARSRRLIEKIDNPDVRYQALSGQIWQLARYDRDEAEDWIRSARLGADQRDALLQQLEQIATPNH